jgi:hypothetical protein
MTRNLKASDFHRKKAPIGFKICNHKGARLAHIYQGSDKSWRVFLIRIVEGEDDDQFVGAFDTEDLAYEAALKRLGVK